ncbi:putative peptide transporter ptr2 [Jimgerdemannia flammicorona]|uniref:Putative peptide transporter ptr2 n=1 Tax=Jimgerdemannia flammicorona TaxID=994334 RepID=A0A433QD37_9FUNG|nr:putative peptide transporter ptr2 [Jimgerdemannia flammicorona]
MPSPKLRHGPYKPHSLSRQPVPSSSYHKVTRSSIDSTSSADHDTSLSSSTENLVMSEAKSSTGGLSITESSPYQIEEHHEDGGDGTVHEFEGLRRVADRIPVAAWFIIVTEFCERFSYYGGSAPFQNYVQFPPGDPNQAGALNKGQSTATALQNFFTFSAYVTPIFGAIVADQYLGRYRTILVFSVIYMSGWLILTATATPAGLAAGAGFPGFIVALVVIGTGTGGIKSIVSPMVGWGGFFTQTELELHTLKTGEKVVVDPELNIQRLYNWFYWAINVGALFGGIICPKLELDVAFWAAFLLPTCMFATSIAIFVAGNRLYVKSLPAESILLKAYRVFAFSRRRAAKPENKRARKEAASLLDFAKERSGLLSAAPMTGREAAEKFTISPFLRSSLVFIPMVIYWVSYSQLSNNLLSQAAQLARPEGVPNDIMNNFDPIALVLFIPIMDSVIYPTLRRLKINFPPMMRITAGFFLGSIAMVWAAILQTFIYRDPAFHEKGASTLSVWLQIPAYFLIAFSEIFASITSLEYSYTHAPKSMKSLVSALALMPNAGSALVGLALSPAARDPNMHLFYAGVAVTAAAAGAAFWIAFGKYDQLDVEYRFGLLERRRAEKEVRVEEATAQMFEMEVVGERDETAVNVEVVKLG